MRYASLIPCLCAVATALACAASPSPGSGSDYLKWVAFEVPISEMVLLRWPERDMPLRVHLPRPPDGLFEDPDAIFESVRDGVLDWSNVAGPGLPTFEFVHDAGDADIPIVWASRPDGDWYVAHCAYAIDVMARRFGVSRILVTGRWREGHVADLHDVYAVVLHEMGHALGLGGHSPDAGDVMFPSVSERAGTGLSSRDRNTLRLLYSRPIGTRIVGARGRR